MTMRAAALTMILLGVTACAPVPPDSGVGFDDYNSYAADREAQLNGATAGAAFDPGRVGAAIDAAEQGRTAPLGSATPSGPVQGALIGGSGQYAAERPRGNAPAGIAVETGEIQGAKPGISDEQDFNAVSARETIESDKERIARNRAQYQVIEPTALPERTGTAEPNIVEFAINTRNGVGEPLYRRSSLRLTSVNAACGRFNSPDLAQEAFLKAGGPERDPKGLDPDGDGFACGWDPRPFRTALQ